MTILIKKILIAILTSIVINAVTMGVDSPKPTQGMNTFAIIVGGVNKDPNEQRAKDKAVTDLGGFLLNKAGIEPNKLSVLVGRPSAAHKDSQLSTADNLKEQIDTLVATIRPTDRFIFYYMGQANVVAEKLRFNLPGPDVTHEQLAAWIKDIRASSMVIVLDCPGAGLVVKTLIGKNRIIIGACTDEQRYSTQFSKYFVPALADLQSDADGDGKVSVLEAFTFTARQLDDSYRRRGLVQTETPILEDNADGVPSLHPWRYRENDLDGLAASTCFLTLE